MQFINNLYRTSLVSCIACVLLCCKKTEVITQEVRTPKSGFIIQVYNEFYKSKQTGNVSYVDSVFHFQNQSDAGNGISYKWDFGDGSTSDNKSASHAYKSVGQYNVTLVTSRDNRANDTARATLSVILGQKDFVINTSTSTSLIDIVEMRDNTFALLGTAYTKNSGTPNYTYLMRLDKNLRQISIKTYPIQTQFNAISVCNDGNLVFTGTTTGSNNKNELIKTTPAGEVLWSKKFGFGAFSKVLSTTDGGYLITGTSLPDDLFNGRFYNTKLIKTNGNGEQVWENVFYMDFTLERTFNTVADGDGFVVAGIKLKDSGNGIQCSYCDSVGIARVNAQGNVVWKTAVEWALNTDRFADVRVAKQTNGNFNVIAAGGNGLYIFSPAGQFLDRKLMADNGVYNSSLTGGNIVVLQKDEGNGFRAALTGYTENGAPLWTVTVNSGLTKPNLLSFSSQDSWPVVVTALADGSSIFAANTVNRDDYGYSVSLVMVDKNGKVL